MNRPFAKPERNRAIADAYRGGTLMTHLAAEHGLSISRISYIVKQQGARLTGSALKARCSAHSVRIARDPVVRAKIAQATRRRWENGERIGRQAILADDPRRREDYLSLRAAYGAAYARQAMGLAPCQFQNSTDFDKEKLDLTSRLKALEAA